MPCHGDFSIVYQHLGEGQRVSINDTAHRPWTKIVRMGMSQRNGWWGLVNGIIMDAKSPLVKSQKSPFLKKATLSISGQKHGKNHLKLKFGTNGVFFVGFLHYSLDILLAQHHITTYWCFLLILHCIIGLRPSILTKNWIFDLVNEAQRLYYST